MMKTNATRPQTVDFVAGLLAKDASMKPAAIVKAAKAKGFHVYPLIFGLARKQLGIGPKAKSGRGPGRPPKAATAPKAVAAPKTRAIIAAAPTAGIEGVIAHMRGLDAEVTRLRGLLKQIGSIAGN